MRVVVAGLLAAVVCMGAAPQPASAADRCARAHALYAAKLFAKAEQEYEKLLGVAPCATAELVTQAREAAASPPPGPSEQLAQALRLQNAGFEEDARALVKSVVQSSATPIPASLRSIGQRTGWWRRQLGRYGPPARFALELTAAIVGLLVAVMLLVTLANRLTSRFLRSARIEGFSGSSEETLTAVLTSALNTMLARMGDEGAGRAVDWQSGTEPKFEIPTAVSEVVPDAGLIAGLVQMLDGLLYRNLEIVSGTVHPVHEHRGAGLTLVLSTRNGRTVDQITIWETEFMLKEAGANATDAVRYERLILPAAVWLAYRRSLGFKSSRPPLHTSDWRSYAQFALGELVPDSAKRRRLYEQALDCDPGNIGARLNLAALLMQRPQDEVEPLTDEVREEIENGSRESWDARVANAAGHLAVVASTASCITEPIWYRARYMQIVCDIYANEGERARMNLDDLCAAISIHGEQTRLRALVVALEQPISVLRKTVELVQTNHVEHAPSFDDDWLTATAEYNLACFWARYAGAPGATAEQASGRTLQAVTLLRRAIGRSEEALNEARGDPAFDAIRASTGFRALTATKPPSDGVESPPTRYAVTLDPGPELIALARDSSSSTEA